MKYLVLSLVYLLGLDLQAQVSDCTNALYQANKLYEAGGFQEALDLIEPCVSGHSLTKTEEFDATRLVSICYLNLNNNEKAAEYAQQMLHIRPNYQTFHYVDPRGLTRILDNYTVRNTLDLGLQVGFAYHTAQVIKNYSAAETPSTYTSQIGFNAGILAEYHLNDRISLVTDPNINSMSYMREMDNVAGRSKEYTESITTIEIPLMGRFYIEKGDWNIFGQLGFQWNPWIHSYADVQSTNLSDGTVIQSSTETTDFRTKSTYGFQLGLGVSRVFGPGVINMAVRYKNFLPNVVLEDKRYDNVDFILSSQYIDSDFSINAIGWSIGYQVPFLYSVKRK